MCHLWITGRCKVFINISRIGNYPAPRLPLISLSRSSKSPGRANSISLTVVSATCQLSHADQLRREFKPQLLSAVCPALFPLMKHPALPPSRHLWHMIHEILMAKWGDGVRQQRLTMALVFSDTDSKLEISWCAHLGRRWFPGTPSPRRTRD